MKDQRYAFFIPTVKCSSFFGRPCLLASDPLSQIHLTNPSGRASKQHALVAALDKNWPKISESHSNRGSRPRLDAENFASLFDKQRRALPAPAARSFSDEFSCVRARSRERSARDMDGTFLHAHRN